MEQETSARIAQLSAQLGQVAEDAERAAAACAAEHARKIAELEDRASKLCIRWAINTKMKQR